MNPSYMLGNQEVTPAPAGSRSWHDSTVNASCVPPWRAREDAPEASVSSGPECPVVLECVDVPSRVLSTAKEERA